MAWVSIAWIGVIFFSSTSRALLICETAFAYVSLLLLDPETLKTPSFHIMHFLADKGLHVTLFFVLAVLLWNAMPNQRNRLVVIPLMGLAVGSCSEFLQRFFPDRDPAIRDVLINLGGTVLGAAACWLFSRARRSSPISTEREREVALG